MHRERWLFRTLSKLLYGMTQLQPARRGVRTLQARVLRFLSLERERERARSGGAFVLRTCASTLLVGGRGWHVGARPCTEREGRFVGAVASMGYGPTPTSAARRAHVASACGALPPERARAVARSRAHTRKLRLLVGGRGWHIGVRPFTEQEGQFAGEVASMEYGPTPTSAARRAHVASARAALPPERESARGLRFFTCARTQVSCSFMSRGSYVGARPCTEGDDRSADAVGYHGVWAYSNQRRGARARRKRACCASSSERESARGLRFLTCERT